MICALYILFFALAVSIKGGLLGRISKSLGHKIDGHILSLIMVAIFTLYFLPWEHAITFTAGWCLIFSSMGEEAGAAGNFKGPWGDYMEARKADGKLYFGRSYGIKKGIQYGMAMGAVMALSVASWCPLIAGASFPAVYWLGSSLGLITYKNPGTAVSEILWGGVIGLGFYLGHIGVLSVGG